MLARYACARPRVDRWGRAISSLPSNSSLRDDLLRKKEGGPESPWAMPVSLASLSLPSLPKKFGERPVCPRVRPGFVKGASYGARHTEGGRSRAVD
jgi:hypothetical protein